MEGVVHVIPVTPERCAVERVGDVVYLVVRLPVSIGNVSGSLALDQRAVGNVSITRREREVLSLVCGGLPNKEIADRISRTERTVKFHVSNLLAKTGSRNRAELARAFAVSQAAS